MAINEIREKAVEIWRYLKVATLVVVFLAGRPYDGASQRDRLPSSGTWNHPISAFEEMIPSVFEDDQQRSAAPRSAPQEEPVAAPSNQRAFARRREIMAALGLDDDLLKQTHRRFPVRWPRYYLDLATLPATGGAVAAMGSPSRAELRPNRYDMADPIADRSMRPVPFVVRKHRDRVIILATKQCHFYCRFCFRREETVQKSMEPTSADWERIFTFLEQHQEIEEPILSGGDPLTLSDEWLTSVRDRFLAIPSIRRWRIHTRAPVHFPQRVTPYLMERLAGGKPLRIVTHFNHPAEITEESRRFAELGHRYGIALANQAVLLRGVNNRVEIQATLWQNLSALGIEPYYLHHPDRVAGNAPFRVTLAEGRGLFQKLVERGGPVPRYVLDLPDGRGKVPVASLVQVDRLIYRYHHDDGTISCYRDFEEEPAAE